MPRSVPNLQQIAAQGVVLGYPATVITANDVGSKKPVTLPSLIDDPWGGMYTAMAWLNAYTAVNGLSAFGFDWNGFRQDTRSMQWGPVQEYRGMGLAANAFVSMLGAHNVLRLRPDPTTFLDTNTPFAFALLPNVQGNNRVISRDIRGGNSDAVTVNIGTPGRYVCLFVPSGQSPVSQIQSWNLRIDGTLQGTSSFGNSRVNDWHVHPMSATVIANLGSGDHTFSNTGFAGTDVIGPWTVILLYDPNSTIYIDSPGGIRNSYAQGIPTPMPLDGQTYVMLATASAYSALGGDAQNVSIAYDDGAVLTNLEVANQHIAITTLNVYETNIFMIGRTTPATGRRYYLAGSSAQPGSAFPYAADANCRSTFVWIPDTYVE